MRKFVKKLTIELIPKRIILSYKFKKYIGYYPNLRNPKTYNEKINWLKLHKSNEENRNTADKYLAREFVRKHIGEKYLIPLLFQTYDIEELNDKNVPNTPFIIKVNHDCGGTKIIQDKSNIDWENLRDFFSRKLKNNYYYYGLEPEYKKIKPCIIIEKLLIDSNGDIPNDYKVYCFNGKAKMIAVDKDREKSTKARNWYDMDWNKKDIFWNTKGDDEIIEKPSVFDEMIKLSEKLSSSFNFLRVDWFIVDKSLYIGELTLHPGSGLVPFYPEKWDRLFGDYLDIKKV